jgi:phosphoglycolate phosphatase
MSIRGVLFDFDLTLADSVRGVTDCFDFALRALELPGAAPEAVHRTIGLPLREAFRALTGPSGEALEEQFVRLFAERADAVLAELTPLYPDVPPTLAWLRRAGLDAAIVSSKFRFRIEDILARAGLREAFAVLVGAEDVSELKPSPEGLLRALGALELERSAALYVGDHPVDARAAAAARVRFVAVLSGASRRHDFAGLPVDAFCSGVGELPGVLQRLAGLEAAQPLSESGSAESHSR